MRFLQILQVGLLSTLGLALGSGAGLSATFTPENNAAAAIPGAQDLSAILQVDALGFECIREEDIDRAFHMTGKGLRLPQTCLPDPCEAALSRPELASFIGRPPTAKEWDDYYARYADTCRREVVAFGPDAATDDDTGATRTSNDRAIRFWTPLSRSYGPRAPIRQRIAQQTKRTKALPPIRTRYGYPSDTIGPLTIGIPILQSLTDGDSDSQTASNTDTTGFPPEDIRLLSSVETVVNGDILATPVPSTLWLMMAGLLGWAGLRRCRRAQAG